LFVKIGFYRVVYNAFGVAVKLPAVDRNRLLRSFWSIVELVGVLPKILLTYVSMLRGYRLVAERYILDTVTTVAYFVNDINSLRSTTSRVLLRFIPKNSVFIFLDSDYQTIFNRRAPFSHTSGEEIPSSRERKNGFLHKSYVEPRDFIEFQRAAYKILAKTFDAFVIDTSQLSIEETSSLILQHVGL